MQDISVPQWILHLHRYVQSIHRTISLIHVVDCHIFKVCHLGALDYDVLAASIDNKIVDVGGCDVEIRTGLETASVLHILYRELDWCFSWDCFAHCESQCVARLLEFLKSHNLYVRF